MLRLLFKLTALLILASSLHAGAPAAPQAESPAPLLRILNSDPSETKRLDALAQLERTRSVDAQQIARSICDTSPAIRAAIVRIGAGLALNDPELQLRLIALSNDRSPLVQAQMLKTLPTFPSARASDSLRKLLIAAARSEDPDLRSLAESLNKAQQTAITR